MEFFDSVPWPFRVFPQSWSKIPWVHYIKVLTVISMWIYIYNVYSFIVYLLSLGGTNNLFTYLMLTSLVQRLAKFVTAVIFVESMFKRNALNKFVSDINAIDWIMLNNLNINVNDEKLILRRVIRWTLFASLPWIVFIVCWWADALLRFSLYEVIDSIATHMSLCWFVIQLYYYRGSIFVEKVRYRYRLINKCIKHFHGYETMDFSRRSDAIRDFLNSDESVKKIKDIRRVCRLLYLASHSINDLFGLSLFVCVFHCFLLFAFSIYVAVVSLFVMYADNEGFYFTCVAIGYMSTIIALASACELTAQEVWDCA